MNLFIKTLAALMLPAAALLSGLAATAAPAIGDLGLSGAVAVVVTVPTPAGITRERLVQLFVETVPAYRNVPGLVRKYYTADEHHFGGIYLFVNRAAAERHFDGAWHERVRATYGADGVVTYFDAPVQITGERAEAGTVRP